MSSGEVLEADASKRTVAFMAPGQNIKSEHWEDGLKLFDESDTQAIYDEVNEAADIDIEEICSRPEEITDPSEIQPAALGIGFAHAEALKSRGVAPDFVVCFSASELLMSALSGSLTLAEAAALSRERGLLQRDKAGGTGGGVAAIHRRPLRLHQIKKDLRQLKGAHFTGKITPLQSTYSYLHGSKEELLALLEANPGIRKVIDIPNLTFPMHSPDLSEVRKDLEEFIDKNGIRFKDAIVPHIATRTARINKKARTIKKNLVWQTDHPINLEDAIRRAVRLSVEDFYDLGPGDTMAALLGRFGLGADIRINPVKVIQPTKP